MTKEKTQALEVVSHALTGSLDEKVRAFEQMATAMAQLQLNGWDNVQKCKAGFWLADGVGEHPAVFIQNHYVMQIKGRLTVEPKWEYMVRKLKETVPGFRFEVMEESDELVTIKMGDGVDSHVVTYSVEDARRQGLFGRGENAWTTGSTREMCFKQAAKRAARRLGVGRATPWVEMSMEDFAEAEGDLDAKGAVEREISGAVVEDQAGAVSSDPDGARRAAQPGDGASNPASSSKGATVPAERPAIMRLSDALVKMYGKQPKAVMLEKATLVYNEMVKANTGTDPRTTFRKVEDIGPVDAENMIEFLANRGGPEQAKPVPSSSGNGSAITEPAADEPPPAESADESEPESEGDEYEHFMMAVKRAKKVFGRKFLVEAPPQSESWWFIDQTTFGQAGHTQSVHVMKGGEVLLGADVLRQLTKIMLTDCDTQERGRA